MSNKTHEGRVALVTGAAQGIGQAIALALAARGAKVIATVPSAAFSFPHGSLRMPLYSTSSFTGLFQPLTRKRYLREIGDVEKVGAFQMLVPFTIVGAVGPI